MRQGVAVIYALEKLLLDPQVRSDLAQLRQLLADDFVEFGQSGQIWSKEDVIAALLKDQTEFQAQTRAWGTRHVCAESAHIHYHLTVRSGNTVRRSLRSSLWVCREGRWQLVFHQGTTQHIE